MDDDALLAELGGEDEDDYQATTKRLEEQIAQETQQAIKLNKAGDKQNALQHMRKKKELEAQLADHLKSKPT